MTKPELNVNIFLVLDIGTSYIKCGYVDSNYNILAQRQRDFPMIQDQNTFEIDFDLFYRTTSELLKECLFDEEVKRFNVEAILITSQAQTFTAVDENFQPLCNGIVWLDERAEKEAVYLESQLSEFPKASGFQKPSSSMYVSKLLWLKQNEPDIYKKASAFPLINEYLVYKLTGEFYSDSTSFGMSGMYDFRRNSINSELLKILGLTDDYFPKIEEAAVEGELISIQIQQEWNLNYRFPIFLCGNDQGASACGAGLKEPGDMNINFGTAMVFYTVTDSLITELTENQIAGKHPVGDDYFLLNFESDFGIQISRLKERFFKNRSYDELFQTYFQFPNVKKQKPFVDVAKLKFHSTKEEHQFCAGVIKYYIIRFKTHLSGIKKVTDSKNIFVSGGMTQSEVWIKIIKEILDCPITVSNQANAGLIGALKIYNNRNI